jgi:hypothetical protein
MELDLFDSWEPISKARKPLGLENWKRLSHMAEQLKGKKAADLTFTTSYPGHEGKKKTLGSIEGNLHFLLGYGNPAFHFAPYHWMVMDPNLNEEDALILHSTKGHPSRPELWERAELEMDDEGDQIEGQPHPSVADVREMVKVARAKAAESITVDAGTGNYTAIPSEGLVYGNHNDHSYSWAMVKDSFFAAANPELMEKMNEAQEAHTAMEAEISYTAEPEEETSEVPEIPEMVKHIAYQYLGEAFEDTTYSLVKSHFPVPSSTVPVESVKGTTLYGVVTTNSIDFYDREGCPVNVSVYDIPFTSFDLTKGGNMFASVVHSFGAKYFGITPDFAQYVVEDAPQQAPRVLEAEASPNFDVVGDTYADLENLDKAIVIEDDGTYRVVV